MNLRDLTVADEDAAVPNLPGPGEVHLWLADLEAADLDSLRKTLTEDEQARAARFRFDPDRNRYVASRGTLRQLLGGYLRSAPGALRFAYNPQGKPSLSPNPADLRFNLSHAGGAALFGFTVGRDVGVDIERPRGVQSDLEPLIRDHLAASEAATVRAAPADQRAETFLAFWTCKEAVLKAIGLGLSMPPRRVEVSPEAWPAKVLAPPPARECAVSAYRTADGSFAAVAVNGTLAGIKTWRIRPNTFSDWQRATSTG